jgi:uncharacterized C2H2 Zn-finger protein
MKRYLIFCETERKTIDERNDLIFAKHLAFKHSLHSHIVKIKENENEVMKFGYDKWKFICDRCGALFEDDAAWITHMSKQSCIKDNG